jgi:hypothetical protein
MSDGTGVVLWRYPVSCSPILGDDDYCDFEDVVEGYKDGSDFTWNCPKCKKERVTEIG